MRIGEILVEQGKLRASDLTRALAEKPSDKRLTSFLIAKGLVDFDDASRALGEQRGFPCALAKHIAGRDPELARLIPPDLGRASCVLPIGKSSKGAIIVCARDPAPALLAQLQAAIRGDVLMVIAPATRLETLIAEAYGKSSTGEFDIDFDLANELPAPTPSRVTRGPLPTPPMPFEAVDPNRTPASPNQFPRAETPPPLPPLPDMTALDPESIRYSLTSLDDYRVTKDPGQSGSIPIRGGTLPPTNKPITTPPLNVLAGSPTTITRATKDLPPSPTNDLKPPTSPPAPNRELAPGTYPPKRTNVLDAVSPPAPGDLNPPTPRPGTTLNPPTSPPKRTNALDAAGPPAPSSSLVPPTSPPAPTSALNPATSPPRRTSALDSALPPPTSPPRPSNDVSPSHGNTFDPDASSAVDDIDLAPSTSWQRLAGGSSARADDSDMALGRWTPTGVPIDPPTSPPARASKFDPETSPPRRAEPFELPPPNRAIDPATRPPSRAVAFDPDTSPPRRASAIDPPTSPPRPTDAPKPPTSPPRPSDALKPPTNPPKRTMIDPDTSPPKHRSLFTAPTSPPKLSGPAGKPSAASSSPSAATARPTTVEEMQAALDSATTREAATDIVLSYVGTRWGSGLVLAIRASTAIGYRGHGVTSPESVTVSLGSPSTVQRAVMTREVSTEAPSGVGQTALVHALGGSRAPTAAPVIVGGQPVAVIAVSEPKEGPPVMAAPELGDIADALGSAYKRIMSR